MKVMYTIEHLAAIILDIDDYEEGEHVDKWEEIIARWERYKTEATTKGHDGDCTKMPYTCFLCLVEDTYARANRLRTLLSTIPQE